MCPPDSNRKYSVLYNICVIMFIYYTVYYFTGIFYAVVRHISVLFIDNKDFVFYPHTHVYTQARMHTRTMSACLSVVCLSVCLSLSVCLCLCLCLSVSLSISVCLSSVSLSVSLSNNLPLTVTYCQSLSFFKRNLRAHLEAVT